MVHSFDTEANSLPAGLILSYFARSFFVPKLYALLMLYIAFGWHLPGIGIMCLILDLIVNYHVGPFIKKEFGSVWIFNVTFCYSHTIVFSNHYWLTTITKR